MQVVVDLPVSFSFTTQISFYTIGRLKSTEKRLIGDSRLFNSIILDATAKSPKNAAKTTPTLHNRGGKVLLTLASFLTNLGR